MLKKQEIEERIRKMAKAHCAYPKCGQKQMMSCGLPIVKILESGKVIVPDSSISISVPLCSYHFRIASMGLLAVREVRNKYMLHGPFDSIRIAEAVFEAKEFSKEILNKPGVKDGS